jgi:glycosyltransferase involved in cell wall biosynthesis
VKILMATHYFASHKGGIEIVAEELFRGLTVREQEVVWIAGDTTPPPDSVDASRPISLRVFNFVEEKIGLPFPIPTLGALRQISASVNDADIVILHDCLYLTNIAAFLFASLRGVPTIVIQHIGFVPYKNPALNALMKIANSTVTRPMLSRAQQVVFISETTKNFFGSLRFKSPPEVVLNGVDTDLYHTLGREETKTALRRHYDLPTDHPVILFVGRFVEKKGISVLKHMVAQRPNYTWVFAGWGPLNPANWNASNVRVCPALRGSSLAALYGASDLLVLPSIGEGFPLVVQEALASGLPVVAGTETLTADPAMTPFVRGVPVFADDDSRTARGFLSAIDDLIASDVESKTASEYRHAFAASRYSWRQATEQYIEIASRLLPEAVSRPAALASRAGNEPR